MSRRFFLLWWALAVVSVSILRKMFDHNTDVGTVVLTVVGGLIAGLLAWLSVRVWNWWHRSRELTAYFSTDDFEAAVNKGFEAGAISKSAHVPEGKSVVVFGISPKNQLKLLSFDIRPVERTWWGGWKSLRERRPISLTAMKVKQLQWHRDRGFGDSSYCMWPNDHGGFLCDVPVADHVVLDANHAIWIEVTIEAPRDWTGWLSFKARSINAPTLFVRRRLVVRADHNILMDAQSV